MAKVDDQAKAIKGKRGKAAKAPARPGTPEVPRTAFNFIAELWAHKRKVRRTNLIVAGAVSTLSVVLFLAGAFFSAKVDSYKSAAGDARYEQSLLRKQIEVITGGIPDLPAHVEERVADVTTAMGTDVDVQLIVDEVLATALPGVTIDSISIGSASGNQQAGGSGSRPSQSADDDASATVKVTVKASTLDGVAWRERVRESDLLAASSPQIDTDGRGSVTLTLNVPLSEVQTRLDRVRQELGVQ